MATTWSCPACQRRVPLSLPVCRCGASRSEALATQALEQAGRSDFVANRRDEPLPWAVKGFFALAAVCLGAALWFLVWPAPPEPIAPLLGWIDPPRASRTPSPSPGSTARRP